MGISEQLEYELVIEENVTISDLQERYNDGICIWVSGSGASGNSPAKYRAAMEYRKHIQYMEKDCPGKTANQAMILAAKDAVERITKPIRVYLISPASLGFENGLKGKGTNVKYLQDLFAALLDRGCFLTEVKFVNGTDAIKRHIFEADPSGAAMKHHEESGRQLRYKEMIYRECLDKVVSVLVECSADRCVIDRIKSIHP